MRTGSRITRIVAALAIATAAQSLQALELGFKAVAGNLQFPWTPITPIADATFPTTNYFWGGEAWMTASLGEDASFRISYDRDPVLRNSAIGVVQFERGIARISVGPLVGFLNSASSPFSAGLSASVRLQWPGVAYVSMRSDGGTAISVIQAAGDPQARTELAAGIYVPNAIVSGLVSAKRFNELDSSGALVTDSLTRYAMTIDIYKKNVPFTAMLSMGYEQRSKHFVTGNITDSLGAVVIGLDSAIQLGPSFRLLGGFSTGAYVLGMDALKNRGPLGSALIFSANLGLSVDTSGLHLFERRTSKKTTPATEAADTAADATAADVAQDAPTVPQE